MFYQSKACATSDLLLLHNWETLDTSNPKYERIQRRRRKMLRRLSGYRRQIELLDSILIDYAARQAKVVDIACGFGFQLLELGARGWKVYGLEIDPNLCRMAGLAGREFDVEIHVSGGDTCSIPFGDESVDVVMSNGLFEHVYDFDLALKEQIRILRPGGLLVIQDGNLLNPKTVFDLLIMYFFRTRGRHGGLRWLLRKHQVRDNLYGYLPRGKDEDIHTPGWWRRRIEREPELSLLRAITSWGQVYSRIPWAFLQFMGSCLVVSKKLDNGSR